MQQKGGAESFERSNETSYTPRKNIKNSQKKEGFSGGKPPFLKRHKRSLLIGVGGLLGVMILALGVRGAIYLAEQRFRTEDVNLTIEGESEVSAGERYTYTVTYTNNTQVTLTNAQVSLEFAEAFQDREINIAGQTRTSLDGFQLPDLQADETFEFSVSGRFVAPPESLQFIRGKLNYRPSSEETSYTSETERAVSVVESPLVLNVNAPRTVTSGGMVEYGITVNNRGEREFDDVRLAVEYPDRFVFVSSSISSQNEDHTRFQVPTIGEGEVFEVRIRGRVSGDVDTSAVLRARVGQSEGSEFLSYADMKQTTKITESYVKLSHNVKSNVEAVSAGASLTYTITFENTTDAPIRNGRLRARFTGRMYDISSLSASGASFDAATNTVTWTAAGVPALRVIKPGEGGSVSYSIDVKDRLPVESPRDKEFTVESKAEFESEEVPVDLGLNKIVESNSSEVKLHTKVFASVEQQYNTGEASIVNSGPNPPEINERTTYTIVWEMKNLTNSVSDVKFESSLPPEVEWTGQTEVDENSELTFQEGSRTVTWTMEEVPPQVGFLKPTRRVFFQVEVTPSQLQTEEGEVQLLRKTSYQGTDAFTGKQLNGVLDELTVPLAN